MDCEDEENIVHPDNYERFLSICEKFEKRKQVLETEWSPLCDEKFFTKSKIFKKDTIIEIDCKNMNSGMSHNTSNYLNINSSKSKYEKSSQAKSINFYLNQDEFNKLQNILDNEDPQTASSDILEIFNSVPSVLVPELCQKLNLSTTEEWALSAILNSVLQVAPRTSLSTVHAIVQYAVYPKLENMKRQISRSLMSSIIALTTQYPKAVIQELLIPGLKHDSLGPAQIDLLTNIMKVEIADNLVLDCLRNCLDDVKPSENIFILLQLLIEKKVYNEEFYNKFISKLKDWSTEYNSNIKFSKMLFSFISLYGNKISNKDLTVIKNIVANNKTFLKRASENFLKKL